MKTLVLLIALAWAASGQEVFDAAEVQNWPQLKRLVQKNSSLANAKDQEGQSILMVVAALESPKTLTFLLDHGADRKAKDKNSSTALMNAISNGDVESAKILWKDQTDEIINSDGKTLLHLAAEANNEKIVEFVLAKTKSMLESKDKKGNTPLLTAVENASPGATRALMKAGANSKAKNSAGKTALQIAQELGLKETLQALQKK